ncbi:winged helix-turn-helix domain-containing protein [Fervidobacterium sp.]|uniref:winged helix-turn-helix domain-containing protein n=1 Tax=Fervidobacterium sp. TaxID=1871331 RepID=UPI0025C44222|nr:winged helix-turn-helix domain-containing protein [Fervidobacterium sp.]
MAGSKDKSKGVEVAFEILEEEIDIAINELSERIAQLSKQQEFDKAKALIDVGRKVKEYKEKVMALKREWREIFEQEEIGNETSETSIQKSDDGLFNSESVELGMKKAKERLKKGLRTPEEEYIIPILESLIELGGKAKIGQVLKRVYEKMKVKLTWYDMQKLPSSGDIRWENTAQWVRFYLVRQGFLSKDSPRGVWEITDKGREYYRLRTNQSEKIFLGEENQDV